MPPHIIRDLRAAIQAEFAPGIEIVDSTLNIIDGQLALREIMGDKAR